MIFGIIKNFFAIKKISKKFNYNLRLLMNNTWHYLSAYQVIFNSFNSIFFIINFE